MGEQLLSEVGQENMNPKDALQIDKLFIQQRFSKTVSICENTGITTQT